MEPIWRANGWDGKVSVTRHEARWRRPAFRAFVAPAEESVDPDDPWVFVRRLAVYWGYTVGSAPPAQEGQRDGQERHAQEMHGDDACAAAASEVDVAWIRRVTPLEGDRNRSRWPTDPTWQVVQAASFADTDPSARRLMRRQQRLGSVQQLDAGAYGYLVSRTAQLHPDGERWDVSWAARELVASLTKIAAAPDKDFGQLVRQRRRQRGLPVTPAPAILPDLPLPPAGQEAHDLRALDAAAEVTLQDEAPTDELRAARLRLAERRLEETLVALEETEWRASGNAAQRRCEDAYEHALASFAQLHSATGVRDHTTPPDAMLE